MNSETVTIRGVNQEIYKELSILAKQEGRNLGDLANDAFTQYLSRSKGSRMIGQGIGILILSRADLERMNTVTIVGCKTLIFGENVDEETFDKHINQIRGCGTVIASESILPKVLSIASGCNVITSQRDEYTDTIEIAEMEELTVSGQDLQESEKPVEFVEIENLVFRDHLDEEAFNKIASIRECGTVSFPKSQIPKLHVYAKCTECNQVTIRDT
jgi:hypothetical protein